MQWCRMLLAVGLTGILGCAGTASPGGHAGPPPGGSQPPAARDTTPPPADLGPGLSIDVLRRASFPCDRASSGLVQLTGGKHVEPLSDGTGEMLTVSLLEEKIAYGDFDGDLDKDAAVVLVADAGHQGVFYDLVAVANNNGEADPEAQIELGDRIRVNFVSIVDGRILVDLTRRGPHDPVGSPTQRFKETYEVGNRNLSLVDRVEVVR